MTCEILLIGISGKRKSGKDTLARNLKLRFNLQGFENVHILHFASSLKGMLFHDGHIARSFLPQTSDAVRKELIALGMKGRQIHESQSLWIDCVYAHILYLLEKKINTAKTPEDKVFIFIIPDVRFINELEYISQKLPIVLPAIFRDTTCHSLCLKIHTNGRNLSHDPDIDQSASEIETFTPQASVFFEPPRGINLHNTSDYTSFLKFAYSEIRYFIKKYLCDKQPIFDKLVQALDPHLNQEFVRPAVYLSHPITFDDNSPNYYKIMLDLCEKYHFEPVTNYQGIENELDRVVGCLQYGLKNYSENINGTNFENLKKSDAVCVYMASPSIGCTEELLLANLFNKPTVIVVSRKTYAHPTLYYWGNEVVGNLEKGFEIIRNWFV
jgi:hypothetical protein